METGENSIIATRMLYRRNLCA